MKKEGSKIKEAELIGKIEKKFPDVEVSLKERTNRIWVKDVDMNGFKEILRFLKEAMEFDHLSTITADDDTEQIRIIYHLVRDIEERAYLNLEVDIDRETPKISTITDIYPAANLYEREEFDLVGVEFQGHPNLERLMLPKDTPEGKHPLRKGGGDQK